MYYSETITLDAHPGIRFEVTQDLDAEDPRDWNDDVQILTYRAPWSSQTDDISNLADTRTLEAFGRVYDTTGDDDAALRFAQRFARIFEPNVTIETFTIHGYSQGDWQDIVIVVPSDGSCGAAEGIARTFEQWVFGDVYTVTEQRPHTWHDGDGNTMTTWEDGDSLSGIYADGPEFAAEYYAAEYL